MKDRSWQLGDIELKSRIGRGGMGEVWWGTHGLTGREVAVKIMGAGEEEGPRRALVMEEIRAVARLNHRRVVKVYDSGRIRGDEGGESGRSGSVYLVMELASGTLVDLGAGKVSWPVVRRVLTQILEGLAHSHSRGVIHRDLKPENVLIFDGEKEQGLEVKLSDFGLAYARDRNRYGYQRGRSYGTPSFMAPERVTGQWRDQGPWTDLYSLGCVAYWLVTGRAPFEGRGVQAIAEAQVSEDVGPLGDAQVPEGFEGWLRGLMAKDRRQRYRRAAKALADLEELDERWGAVVDEDGLGDLATEAVSETAEGWALRDKEAIERPQQADLGDWRRSVDEKASPEPLGMGLGLYGLRNSAMVGREKERDRIWGRLKEVMDKRRARALMVRSEAGQGATRLVRWMAQRAHEKGAVQVLEINQGPHRRPGVAMAHMVRETLQCQGLDREGVEVRVARLALEGGALAALDEHHRQSLVDLMMATGAGGDAEAPRKVDARHIGLALVRWIQALTQERPVVVIVDNAQWGAGGVELVEGLLTSSRQAPVLALVTFDERGERFMDGTWQCLERLGEQQRAEFLELGPLSLSDHAALVDGLLRLEPELAQAVWERTEGHPLFAVELVGEWVEAGALTPSPRGYGWRDGGKPAMPESLEALLEGRVERFLADVDEVRRADVEQALELGAALGHRVRFEEWWRCCREVGLDTPDNLYERLLARELVTPWAAGWAFEHGQLHRVVERRARRQQRWEGHHRVCLTVLDQLYGDQRGAVQHRRAYHLMGAGEEEASLEPMLKSIKHLVETSQMEAAGRAMARYTERFERLGLDEGDERWVGLLEQRSVWHGRQGEIDEGWQVVQAMEEALSDDSDVGLWGKYYYHRAYHLHLKGEPLKSNEWADKALNACGEAGDEVGEGLALYLIALNASWVGDMDIMGRGYQMARDIFASLDDDLNRAKTLIGLGNHRSMIGDHQAGVALIEEGIAIYEELGDPYAAAIGYSNLGECQWHHGDLEGARRSLQKGKTMMEAVGSGDVTLCLNLCCVLIAEEEFEEAAGVLDELMSKLEGSTREGLLGVCYATYLPIMAHRQDWEEWDDNMMLAAAYLKENSIVDKDLAWTFEEAARLAKEAGEEERANRATEQARAQRRQLEARSS